MVGFVRCIWVLEDLKKLEKEKTIEARESQDIGTRSWGPELRSEKTTGRSTAGFLFRRGRFRRHLSGTYDAGAWGGGDGRWWLSTLAHQGVGCEGGLCGVLLPGRRKMPSLAV